MAKFLDLYNQAKQDLSDDQKSDEAVSSANQEKMKTSGAVATSSPALAAAIKAAGGYVINTSVQPPTLLVSNDGTSFMEVGASTTDDDAPQNPAPAPVITPASVPGLPGQSPGPMAMGETGPMAQINPGRDNPIIAPRT